MSHSFWVVVSPEFFTIICPCTRGLLQSCEHGISIGISPFVVRALDDAESIDDTFPLKAHRSFGCLVQDTGQLTIVAHVNWFRSHCHSSVSICANVGGDRLCRGNLKRDVQYPRQLEECVDARPTVSKFEAGYG